MRGWCWTRYGASAMPSDYTGQPITAAAMVECLAQAKALEKALLAHLRAKHPHLLALDS